MISYNTSIVRDGLVLHLDAANVKSYPGSGTVWKDIRSGNDGQLVNDVTYNSSQKGFMTFNNTVSNDYVDCGSASFLNSSLAGLTVSCWFKIAERRVSMIVENGTSFSNNTFYMALESITNFSFLVYGSGGYDRVFANNNYSLDQWYNFVGVWDPSFRCKAYLNGLDTSQARAGVQVTELISGNTNLLLGLRPGNSIPFSGSISNFSIYNRALTATEVKQNFEAYRGRYGI